MRSRIATACVVVAAAVGFGAAPASAAGFSLAEFRGSVVGMDGSREAQAGSHPDIEASFEISSHISPETGIGPDANIKDVTVDLPAGLVGDPTVVPTCPDVLLSSIGAAQCPGNTQVGSVEVSHTFGFGSTTPFKDRIGLYNLAPPPGVAARFGFNLISTVALLDARLTANGEYHVTVTSKNTSQGLAIIGVRTLLWGVPADPKNDALRADHNRLGSPSDQPRRPFISLPTACPDAPHKTTISMNSWQDTATFVTGSFDRDAFGPLVTENCEALPFEPSMTLAPTTSAPDAPAGLDARLELPQSDSPDGLSTAHLKDVEVTLPEGMTINPGSADGLAACSDAQLALGQDTAATCPDASKIGTVTARTPLLAETLQGGIYLRSQASDDPESGDLFRVAIELINKDRGVDVKLGGRLFVNASTGRIKAVFNNNPKVPVSDVTLAFKSGARAPLATPAACGNAGYQAHMTAWSGRAVDRSLGFPVDCKAGLGGFAPAFAAGVRAPRGGAFSPFALTIQKPDGNTPLAGLRMQLPEGLIAMVKGNVGQQVGTVKTFAGPGTNPYVLPGKVYLEGRYDDAPFSLRVVVPAKAGPFDLGDVIVRQKIYVNPENAQVTIVSDPIPTVVKGVPVRLQRLEVDIDKPGFMINPTSCAAKEIKGTLASVAGQTAALTNRFQVGECSSLGYTPKLAMTMTGKGQTKDGSHPALNARLTPPAGDANNKKVTVTLPLSLALDPGNANGLCEPADAAKNKCPAASIVGSAQAQSILPDTLKAPVYFVRGERLDSKGKVRKTLPKLFLPLTANGVTVNVWGDSDVEDERLVTTFNNLPDAPFTTFDLNINGGKHGILAVSSSNTCAATQIADAEFGGQNGKAYTSKVTMGTPCALGIVKSSHTSTALKLTIGGLGAGKVSASGDGVAKASKTLASATTATLSLKLSKATRRALARGRDVKVKMKVAFTAKGQKKAKTATKTLVIHGAKKR
jgi:hypothetical protein